MYTIFKEANFKDELPLSPSEVVLLKQKEMMASTSYIPAIIERYNTPTRNIYSDFHSRYTIVMASIFAFDTTDDLIQLIKLI